MRAAIFFYLVRVTTIRIALIDPLYGCIEEKWLDEIIAVPLLQRLKGISLDNIPRELYNASPTVNRYEHSIGAAFLASITGHEPLKYATLFHDVAIPPFSHISEPTMVRLLGKDHETLAAEVVEKDRTLERILESHKADLSEVVDLLSGRHRLSGLINGSIDFDNIDNVARYSYHCGWNVFYDPIKLVKGLQLSPMMFFEGSREEILGWKKTRFLLYQKLTKRERRIRERMLSEAVETYIQLTNDGGFFSLTNTQAIFKLKTNLRTGYLIKRLERGDLFSPIFYRVLEVNINRKKLEEIRKKIWSCSRPDLIYDITYLKSDKYITIPVEKGQEIRKTIYPDFLVIGVYSDQPVNSKVLDETHYNVLEIIKDLGLFNT